METKLYLDVDGVLNPFRAKNPIKHWSDYKKHPTLEGYRVWRSQEMGAWLKEIIAVRNVEFVWATSWVDRANGSIGKPLGLPELRVLPFYGTPEVEVLMYAGNCGKLPVVSADCGVHPVIWIDDEHGRDDKAWAAEREHPTLLITPNSATGLRKQDLVAIEDFLYVNR